MSKVVSTYAINLRSDTQTLPTRAMMEAMCSAPLGDDTCGEDPTVQRLETLSAERFGKEAGLFVLSGTIGESDSSHGAIECGRRSDSGRRGLAYLFITESGGLSSVAGLMPMPVASDRGIDRPPATCVNQLVRMNMRFSPPRLLCLENSHNRGGGRVIPLALHRELFQMAREHGLGIHLDGARIFNAAIAAKTPVAEYASTVDTVMFCLTKGLSCPMGSVVVGSSDFDGRAKRMRKRLRRGMRQAGVVATAGIVALGEMGRASRR